MLLLQILNPRTFVMVVMRDSFNICCSACKLRGVYLHEHLRLALCTYYYISSKINAVIILNFQNNYLGD